MSIGPDKAAHLLDSMSTAVLLFDDELRLTGINTAGEDLLSVSFRMLQGLSAGDILPDSPAILETLGKALRNRRPYTRWGVELPTQSGGPLIAGCTMTPLLEGDQCSEVILELVDSHSFARVMREENVNAMHLAARKSVSGLAHEIKNPLGGLRGAAQLLERELGDDDLREYTRIIINEADRLRNLVDRMLGPSNKSRMEQLNIHEVLEYVSDLIQAEFNHRFDINRDYDPSIPNTQADREQLIQAFLNVARNAVQAIDGVDNGQIQFRTRIRQRCTIQQRQYKLAALVEIIDNGSGIPNDIGGEIFYPLITGRAEGTGLGLSIAQSLLQRHGATIDYDRVSDRTVFRIMFPLSAGND